MPPRTEPDKVRGYFETSSWTDSAGRQFLASERRAHMREAAAILSSPPAALAVCDVGCGGGRDLATWRDLGVPERNLAGTELVPQRAAQARTAVPDADIREVSGFDLPFPDTRFDITTASLVLSTTASRANRAQLMAEMARITRPGGLVLVYDFVISKPWNAHVWPVRPGELIALWRRPDATYRLGPFLPGLEVALHIPHPWRQPLLKFLPRTHRLWVWSVLPADGSSMGRP